MHYNQSNYQQRISQPPEILTDKDSLYLSDALSWELLAAKKAYNMAQECQDGQLRAKFEQLSDLHHNHYQMLLNHFQPQQQQSAQQSYTNHHYQ